MIHRRSLFGLLLSGVCLGAPKAQIICPLCKEPITKTDFYCFQDGKPVHLKEAHDHLHAKQIKAILAIKK